MKKTLVAKCAAALIGTAMAAGASAAVVGPAPTTPGDVNGGAAGSANALTINTDGIGHILFVPYYSVQNGNDTYLNIVNTDTLNGKAVKVRFRGAANSDDVFDFTILMSPGDVWAAAVTRGADGRAKLVTNDKSCTLPAVVSGASFPTARLKSSLTDEQKAEQTREGYIEILNMADIPPSTALYTAIKHTSAGVPKDCAANAITSETLLKAHATSYADAQAKGLEVPTTGLTANWTIINVAKSAAWTGAATAVEARIASTGAAAYGNVVFSPQNDIAGVATPSLYTSDPLLRTGAIAAVNFDFPDLSTPYVNFQLNAAGDAPLNDQAPVSQAEGLTGALAVTSVANEYVTDVGVNAKTDWTFSMPTRRYNVARNYAGAGSNAFTDWSGVGDNYFTVANTTTETAYPNTICVTGISTAGGTAGLDGATTADREERFVANATEYVISPGTQAAPLTFCGEVSVLSFNAAGQTSALGGVITRKDLTLPYADGWVRIATPGLGGIGLPLVGASFVQFTNNAAQAGTVGTYGMTYPNRMVMLLFPPIPMRAKYFVLFYGLLELYLGVSGGTPRVAHYAHLGGMAFGFVLLRYWTRPRRGG